MMNKRLMSLVPESKKLIYIAVFFQWLALLANMTMIFSVTRLIYNAMNGNFDRAPITAAIFATVILLRFICLRIGGKMSFKASECVKAVLREKIYRKLLRLGTSYKNSVSTSEVTQLMSEGVEQLEIYFGQYMPQLFYAVLAPVTLFATLAFINIKSAALLLACVPLIPILIIMVQKLAKKLLTKYWKKYTDLGDVFLENLQGLTTLKIYQADDYKHKKMDHHAELFRKATMKVLVMQLNSISIMDLVAYGGAAIGAVIAVSELMAGNLNLANALAIILLSAEFFIPMRLLGSFFHIAMNGTTASKKMFKLLDTIEEMDGSERLTFADRDIHLKNINFSYTKDREILKNINIDIQRNSFSAIIGESGCGKSTIAALLTGESKGHTRYAGSIKIGDKELCEVAESSLIHHITLVSDNSYLFSGTIRDNLIMGNEKATDKELMHVLEQVNILDFVKSENGLDTVLTEKGANISGGQRQRIALARAILHDSPIYIFDEATSNIDIESEEFILNIIYDLSKIKTVLFITHRLANVINADQIFVIKDGMLYEQGNHEVLLQLGGVYSDLYTAQNELEKYSGGGQHE